MLLSYTHYERLFRGNTSGKSTLIRHVKNAQLPYHWLILQDVPYLLDCQVILFRKLLRIVSVPLFLDTPVSCRSYDVLCLWKVELISLGVLTKLNELPYPYDFLMTA